MLQNKCGCFFSEQSFHYTHMALPETSQLQETCMTFISSTWKMCHNNVYCQRSKIMVKSYSTDRKQTFTPNLALKHLLKWHAWSVWVTYQNTKLHCGQIWQSRSETRQRTLEWMMEDENWKTYGHLKQKIHWRQWYTEPAFRDRTWIQWVSECVGFNVPLDT